MDNDMMTGYLAGKSDGGNGNGNGNFVWPWMAGMGMGGMGMGFGGMGWGGGMMAEWFPLLLLAGIFGWGNGNGFGGNRGGAPATQADLAAGFANSTVLSSLDDIKLGQANAINYNNQGFAGLNTSVMQGFNGVNNAICTLGYNMQSGFNGITHQIADCCCQTQRLVERGFCDTNYNIQSGFNAAMQAGHADTDRVIAKLDAMETNRLQEKLAAMRDENLALKFAASQERQNNYIAANQEAQTAELIRRLDRNPCPIPAYVVPNPNCCYGNPLGVGYNVGNACGCCA